MCRKYILLILLVWPFFTPAQTVKWMLKPTYSSITCFSENLYLVKSGNKCGVVNNQGKSIANDADSITPYVEGHALLLDNYGKQWKILGIMDKSGNVSKPENAFYVSSYLCFSEGFLAVSNSNGEYGFINPLGKEVIPCKYKMTRPFSEGFASVTLNNKRVIYINAREQPLRLEAGDGEIYFGTNFKNGEALVSTIDKKLYFIGKQGNIIRKVSSDIIKKLSINAQYCISSDTKSLPAFQEMLVENRSTDDGIVPYHDGNLYGYKNENTIVLPPQFDNAFPFVNGTAKVYKNGKYGLLAIVSDRSITAKIAQTSLKVKKGVPEEDIECVVNFPVGSGSFPELSAVNLKKNLNEKFSLASSSGENFVFKFRPQYDKGEKQQEYQFQLKADDLILWEDRKEILFKPVAEPVEFYITITPNTSEANEKDEAWISVNFVNTSDVPIEITVEITGDKLKVVSTSITIPANSTKTVRTCFTEVIKKENRSVRVSTSKGNKAASTITLTPFY